MTGRGAARLAVVGALVLATAGITACSTVSVSSNRYLGVRQFATTDPATVEILRREPRRPHEKLGEVYLEPSGNPAVAEMEQAIRTEAAKLGADAAVLVYDRTKRIGTVYQGPWWARSSHAVYGRKIVAVAIRYKR
ncbi:MAG: hypothetical protein A2Y78_04705 [Acidobacteria bacterium RBG_13_68_16]|nr:MAG: hypothetical protein A2Y78_04705 [Acidobacteria bacterium RBG_13_68_16]